MNEEKVCMVTDHRARLPPGCALTINLAASLDGKPIHTNKLEPALVGVVSILLPWLRSHDLPQNLRYEVAVTVLVS